MGFAVQYSLMGGLVIVTAQIHMGMGGHSLGMMSCKGNLEAWEVGAEEGSWSHRGHSKLTSLPASGPNPFLVAQESFPERQASPALLPLPRSQIKARF